MRRILLLIVLVASTLLADAQSFYAVRRNRNLLLNVGSGTANYFGEMVNPRQMGITKPNVAIGAEYFLTPRISAKAEFTWFQLSGDDARANDDRVLRNLSFRSNNWEFTALGAVNLTPMGRRFYQRSLFNFHAFAGIGVLYMNPKAIAPDTIINGVPLPEAGQWVALQPLETEGVHYSRFQPVIPFGLGARFKLNPFFNVLLEAGYRLTFTDYLDDASSVRHPDPATLKSDLARVMSMRRTINLSYDKGKRGNPKYNDGYFIANLTLQYYFPEEIFGGGNRKLYNSKRKSYYRRPKGR